MNGSLRAHPIRALVGFIVAILLVCWAVKAGILKQLGGLGAVLFGVYVDASFNVYSSLTSSPWTFENFARDPDRARTCRYYVMLANGVILGLGLFGTIVASNAWPLIGAAVVMSFMWFIYWRAIAKGEAAGAGGKSSDNQWATAGANGG